MTLNDCLNNSVLQDMEMPPVWSVTLSESTSKPFSGYSYSSHIWDTTLDYLWDQRNKISELGHVAAAFFPSHDLLLWLQYNVLLQSQVPETRYEVLKGQKNQPAGLFAWKDHCKDTEEQNALPALNKHFCKWEL